MMIENIQAMDMRFNDMLNKTRSRKTNTNGSVTTGYADVQHDVVSSNTSQAMTATASTSSSSSSLVQPKINKDIAVLVLCVIGFDVIFVYLHCISIHTIIQQTHIYFISIVFVLKKKKTKNEKKKTNKQTMQLIMSMGEHDFHTVHLSYHGPYDPQGYDVL